MILKGVYHGVCHGKPTVVEPGVYLAAVTQIDVIKNEIQTKGLVNILYSLNIGVNKARL